MAASHCSEMAASGEGTSRCSEMAADGGRRVASLGDGGVGGGGGRQAGGVKF
jgi:hypothetical protein